ncbi:DUF5518 domain-containing protein [Halobacterium litoreum]|uniref:DUF5518 domain-containing protein n=1 Tax=Halobacterium litoreum TaxID=2039234 RepID=A0ABD5NFV3_9EURY|nr:DUF5518 domain-containing protein [Halobacterium litoreum]UHH13051.1 DUF5518 domain-containing protein [Halobacterium litoreum]
MVKWRAVFAGFAVQFVLGVFAFAIPGVGHAAAGLLGGFTAGWLAKEGVWGGAVNGLLAGALGGLVVASFLVLASLVVSATGLVPAGLLGLGVAAFSVVVFLLLAVDSAIAGAIGGWLAAR